jgi:hypothetical protein
MGGSWRCVRVEGPDVREESSGKLTKYETSVRPPSFELAYH